MELLDSMLCVLFILGLHYVPSHQNSAPRFATSQVDGVDGNLYQRLTYNGIAENLPRNTLIGTLKCIDNDNTNAQITYSVEGNTLKVDPDGTVYLNRLLDRENSPANSVNSIGARILVQKFFCRDATGLSANVEIEITITDKNDNAPQFKKAGNIGGYSGTIKENTPAGTKVSLSDVIEITDIDRGQNAAVTLSCYEQARAEAQIACEFFDVRLIAKGEGSYTAEIILKKTVDYEKRRSYTMTIMAKDQGVKNEPQLNSTVNILIDVEDTQDAGPEFLNLPLTVYLDENVINGTKIDTKLSAQDQDAGAPRAISITIHTDPQNLFTIGPSTTADGRIYKADIITRNVIDREALKGLYFFQVKATEMDNGVATNFFVISNVTVNIQDKNDNEPMFAKSNYEVNVTELDSTDQTQIANLNIQITDLDDSSNARYEVLIGTQTFPGAFTVFPAGNVTGNVALSLRTFARYLDYDNPQYRKQIIYIEARELKGGRTQTGTVTINLLDLNDNSPTFSQGQYSSALREDASVGSSIITITAIDKDEGENGRVTYALRGTDLNIFNLNKATGEIRLALPLDFEKQTEYPVIFVARDQGNPQQETTTTFTLRVTDFNDLGPLFNQPSYQTYASESTKQLQPAVTVKATDPENPSGIIIYSIVDGNIANSFSINSSTGDLTLSKLIDYEQTNNGVITLIVQAVDRGLNGEAGLRTNTTITINVQDENNHSPVFDPSSYTSTISEVEATGTVVATVTATDSDFGENGVVRYFIDRGGLDNFEINEFSGVMTISTRAQFDYDVIKQYKVVVYSIDTGGPPQTGTTTVVVTLNDANNKNPEILQQLYTFSVQDDIPIGTELIKINATDIDSSSLLRYSIPSGSIIARDGGGSEINDVSQFDYPKSVVIDTASGVVRTSLQLNRDKAAEISFQVQVEDINSAKGVQTATTSIIVTILGTRPSAISFSSPWKISEPRYYFTINEDQSVGSDIMTLNARDPVCLCPITNFTKVSETGGSNFFQLVGATVRLNKSLDYENAEERSLSVVLLGYSQDMKRSATATIVVSVDDDNDNSPVFSSNSGYRFTVSENAKYPVRVGSVFANDADSGSYGEVEYSLSGQNVNDFSINLKSGDIYVSNNTNLNHETRTSYSLQVIARDNPRASVMASEIRKQSSIVLIIDVTDENDNTPSFGQNTEYNFYTVESFEVGSQVGSVSAQDIDSGTNSQLSYYIQSGTSDATNFFRIEPSTGIIRTTQRLRDKSIFSPYQLIVIARDRGRIPLQTTTKVIIHVSSGQLNDGSPLFSFPEANRDIRIPENSPIGTDVIQVIGVSRFKAPLIYSFVTNSNQDYQKFAIDRDTGNITVNGTLDREQQSSYTLIVSVKDSVNKSETLRMLTIDLIDVDDNQPSFNPNQNYPACKNKMLPVPVMITIVEERPINTFVYTVEACDPDSGVNTARYYPVYDGICKSEMDKMNFNVSENGTIYTNKVLDREVQETYLVCVGIVKNNRGKRAVFNRTAMVNTSDVAYVEVTVTDLNDNTPTFPFPKLQQVLLSVPQSEQVLQVSAMDNDKSPFNRVRYTITGIQYYDINDNFPLPGAFLINPDTGIITVGFPSYTDFVGNYFVIDVLAEDFYNSKLNHTSTVYVYIFDKLQSMRIVLDESPDSGVTKAQSIINELNGASTNNEFKLQQISYHSDSRGNTDVSKTDICFVVVNNQKVLSVKEGESQIDQENNFQKILQKYKVMDKGSCYQTSASSERVGWSDLWWVLVFVAIFIFVCCLILIIAVCILHRNYKTRKVYMVPQ